MSTGTDKKIDVVGGPFDGMVSPSAESEIRLRWEDEGGGVYFYVYARRRRRFHQPDGTTKRRVVYEYQGVEEARAS